MNILSQKGRAYAPHLLQKTVDDHGQAHPYHAKPIAYLELENPEYWNVVHQAMQAVIDNNEGTGARFGRNANYKVAGKTGTAQVFALSQNDHNQKTIVSNKKLKDHSWFIAFAPVEHPRVAIAAMVEHDTTASMVARQVLDAYFQLYPEETNHEH